MLALLCAGFFTPVDARILTKLRRAGEFFAKGEKALAQIHLAQLGLPPLRAEQALRLALADRLIETGFDPGALCKSLGFDLPAGLKKFNPDQPRDEHGRWTSGGAGVAEGRSISPGGPHGGDKSEEDKLEDFKSKFEEDSPQEDIQHGRPINPLGPTPAPFAGQRSAGASGPKPADFVGRDFGKYGVGVEKPDLKIGFWNDHAKDQARERMLSVDEIRDIVANPLLVTRQSNSRFLFLNDNGAAIVDDNGRLVRNYGSSNFKQGILDILKRIHSGER
ncbi:hypothetical protein [Methylocella silvestris]|nr:hypothetical protein [Methylocella silvestris]